MAELVFAPAMLLSRRLRGRDLEGHVLKDILARAPRTRRRSPAPASRLCPTNLGSVT